LEGRNKKCTQKFGRETSWKLTIWKETVGLLFIKLPCNMFVLLFSNYFSYTVT